jgi:tetratricopeptide (TPR) repeat protein
MLGRVYNTLFEITQDDSYLLKAKEILNKGLAMFPRRVDFWYEIAQTQMYQKNYTEAEQSFNKAKELNPDLVDVYWYMGVTKVGQKHYSEAKADFQEAINRGFNYKDSSNRLRILLNLGFALKDWNFIITHHQDIVEIISPVPGNEDVYLLLALAYKRTSQESLGREVLIKLSEFNPAYKDVNGIWSELSE